MDVGTPQDAHEFLLLLLAAMDQTAGDADAAGAQRQPQGQDVAGRHPAPGTGGGARGASSRTATGRSCNSRVTVEDSRSDSDDSRGRLGVRGGGLGLEGGRRRGRDEGESACRVVAKTRVFTNVWQNAIKLRPGIELDRSNGRAAGKGTGEEADFYVIVPCTYEPLCEGRFSLQVISTQPEVPCVLQPITQRPSKAEIAGRWTVDCAGGCCNHPTWMRNPIFLLDLPHTSRHQYPQPTLTLSVGEAETSVGLGGYVFP